MQKQTLTQDLNSFPASPGVYLMKNSSSEILYIGKAKNLKQRIKQYFIPGRDSRAMRNFNFPSKRYRNRGGGKRKRSAVTGKHPDKKIQAQIQRSFKRR